jgi:choline dehydrogenase-like flavoprotein
MRPGTMTDFMRNVSATARRIDRPDVAGMTAFEALLFARSEQAPNPDSRVFLVDERDALGMRRVKLDWRLRDEDRHSLHRSIELIGLYLGQHGWGRGAVDEALWDSWLETGGGSHHMGTTRMHDDPKQGVVDADCRVHSVANLYIGGSSVYPTTGFANPVMTTLALTLRLGEHLVQKLEAA